MSGVGELQHIIGHGGLERRGRGASRDHDRQFRSSGGGRGGTRTSIPHLLLCRETATFVQEALRETTWKGDMELESCLEAAREQHDFALAARMSAAKYYLNYDMS